MKKKAARPRRRWGTAVLDVIKQGAARRRKGMTKMRSMARSSLIRKRSKLIAIYIEHFKPIEFANKDILISIQECTNY